MHTLSNLVHQFSLFGSFQLQTISKEDQGQSCKFIKFLYFASVSNMFTVLSYSVIQLISLKLLSLCLISLLFGLELYNPFFISFLHSSYSGNFFPIYFVTGDHQALSVDQHKSPETCPLYYKKDLNDCKMQSVVNSNSKIIRQ